MVGVCIAALRQVLPIEVDRLGIDFVAAQVNAVRQVRTRRPHPLTRHRLLQPRLLRQPRRRCLASRPRPKPSAVLCSVADSRCFRRECCVFPLLAAAGYS